MKTKKEILEEIDFIINELMNKYNNYEIVNNKTLESFILPGINFCIKINDYKNMINDDNFEDFNMYIQRDNEYKIENKPKSRLPRIIKKKIYVSEFIYADLLLSKTLDNNVYIWEADCNYD